MQNVRSSVQLKKYRIACWRTSFGYYEVEAQNEKEAQFKAYQHLWNGVEMDGTNDMRADILEVQES